MTENIQMKNKLRFFPMWETKHLLSLMITDCHEQVYVLIDLSNFPLCTISYLVALLCFAQRELELVGGRPGHSQAHKPDEPNDAARSFRIRIIVGI